MNKLNVKAFGLACGLLWSAGVLLMGLTAMACPWALPFVKVLAVMYRGYSPDVVGSVVGSVWGFVDAGLGGLAFAWLYNKLLKQ